MFCSKDGENYVNILYAPDQIYTIFRRLNLAQNELVSCINLLHNNIQEAKPGAK